MTEEDLKLQLPTDTSPAANPVVAAPTREETLRFALTDRPSGESDEEKAVKAEYLGRTYFDLLQKAQRGIDPSKDDDALRAEAVYFTQAMTGQDDVYGKLWKKGGFKTGREYLEKMHDFFLNGGEKNLTKELKEFQAKSYDEQVAEAMAARSKLDALKHAVGYGASYALDWLHRADTEKLGHEKELQEDIYKRQVRAEYAAKLLADNAWHELSAIMPTLSADGQACAKALMDAKDNRLPEQMWAKFNNLEDQEKALICRVRTCLAPRVEGTIGNTIGDMAIGAANVAATVAAAPWRFGNKIGMLISNDAFDAGFDVNELARRRQYLWQATGRFFAGGAEGGYLPQMQFEQICQEHGFLAESLIGAVSTLPYMAAAAVPGIGVATVAMEAMSQMDDHVAMSGGDIADPDYMFSNALFGAMYAYTERLQVDGLLGGVKDIELRQAMLKGFWSGVKNQKAVRTLTAGTLAESLQEGLQNGIMAANEALALKEDATKAFAEGFTQDFIGSLGTMLVVEGGGLGFAHWRRSGFNNPFSAAGREAGREARSIDLETEYEKDMSLDRMVEHAARSEELRGAMDAAEAFRLFKTWESGGKDALIKAGIDPVRAEEWDYFYSSTRDGVMQDEETGEDKPDVRWQKAQQDIMRYLAHEALKRTKKGEEADLAAFDLAMQNLDWVRSAWSQGAGIRRVDEKGKVQDPGEKALEELGFSKDVAQRLSEYFHYERSAAYSPAALNGIKARYDERMAGKVTAKAALARQFGGHIVRFDGADFLQFTDKGGGINLVRIDETPGGIDFAEASEGVAIDVERATDGEVTKQQWMDATEDERKKIWKRYGLTHEGSFRPTPTVKVTIPADPSVGIDSAQAATVVGAISLDSQTDNRKISDTSVAFHEVYHAFSAFAQASGLWTKEDIAFLEKTCGKAKHTQETHDEEAGAEAFRSFLARRANGAMTVEDERSPFMKIYAAAAGLDARAKEKAAQEKVAGENEKAFFDQLIAEANKPKPKPPAPKPDLPKTAAPQRGIKPGTEEATSETKKPETETQTAQTETTSTQPPQETQPGAPRTWSAYTPTGNVKVSGHWAVLDLKDVIHSNNPLYAVHMRAQLRNRKDNKAEEDTRKDIVNNFQGERLLDAPDTANGAPIVFYDDDGTGVKRAFVLSGNGRVLVLNELAERHLYDHYRNVMKKWAAANGIMVPSGQTPILVRVIDDYGGVTRDKVADLSNTNSIQQYTEEEQARADAEVIKALGLAKLYQANADGSPDMTPGVNDEFFAEFVRGVGDTSLYNSDRSLTQTARDRAQRALLAIAVGQGDRGRDVVKKLVEQTATLGIQRQKNAAAIMAAPVAALESNVAYAIGPDVSRAMADFMDYAEKRRAGKVGTFKDYFDQMDLLDAPSHVARELLALFGSDKSAATIAEYVKAYCKEAAMEDPAGGLFGAARTKDEIWNDAKRLVDDTLAKQQGVGQKPQRGKGGEGGGVRFSVDAVEAQRQYDEVVARYTNEDGTRRRGWMRAPNGQPTKLTERQWVQVRTPSFKKWFGDWESMAELAPSEMVDAKTAFRELMARNAELKTADGATLRFVSQSAKAYSKEAERESADRPAHWCAVANIEELVGRSRLMYEEGPRNGSPDIAAYVKYGAVFTFGGERYLAKITSKRYAGKDAQNFYRVESVSVEKIAARGIHEAIAKGQPLDASDTDRISKILEESKGASKVVDENGEPLVVYRRDNEAFNVFDVNKAQQNDAGWLGKDFYFYGDRREAESATGYGKNLREFYLKAENPYYITPEEYNRLVEADDPRVSAEFTESLREEGYDSVYWNGDGRKEWMVLEPTQIKSETDNTGAFDAANPDIRYSISGVYTGTAADYANRSRQGGKDDGPSLLKIGSGEGTQVYGWGLYGSTVRGVAEGYARQGRNLNVAAGDAEYEMDGKSLDRKNDVIDSALTYLASERMNTQKAIEEVNRAIDGFKKQLEDTNERLEWDKNNFRLQMDAESLPRRISHLNEVKGFLERDGGKIRQVLPSENIYEQTFFTNRAEGDESHLLKWYEDLPKEQVDWIAQEFAKEGFFVASFSKLKGWTILDRTSGKKMSLWDKRESGEAYEAIAKFLGSPQAASEFLYRAGIDGVKYPVDSYGGKTVKNGDKAGWNYVAFSDDNIRVDHKWTDGQMRYSITTLGKYNTDDFRDLAHRVKDGDSAAIADAGRRLAKILPKNAVLVPMPSRTGEPTTMRALADAIAANADGATVVDALRSNPHESSYERKKRGDEPEEVEMRRVAEIPKGREVYVVDNVIDTGATYHAAMHTIHDAHLLALADTDKTPAELRQTIAQNIDHILSRFDAAKGLSKKDVFAKFDNRQLEIGWLPSDLALPDELQVAKRSVMGAEAFILDHIHNKPGHEKQLTADDARRMLANIDPNNEMRVVPQRGSLSLAFIAPNPAGGWDCTVIAPHGGALYVFKTMFGQTRKPYQDKSLIRYSVSVRRNEAADRLIRGGLSSIRDFSETPRSIAQTGAPAQGGRFSVYGRRHSISRITSTTADIEADACRAITASVADGDKNAAQDALESFVAYFKLAHGSIPRPQTLARIGLSLGMNVVNPKRILKNAEKLAEQMKGTVVESAAQNGDVATTMSLIKREKDIGKKVENLIAGGVELGGKLTHKGVGKINSLLQKRVESMMRDFTAASLADMEGDTGIDIAAEIIENNPDAFETEYRRAKKATGEADDGSDENAASPDGQAQPDRIPFDESEMSDAERYKREILLKEQAERVAKFIEAAKRRAEENGAKAAEARERRRVVELQGGGGNGGEAAQPDEKWDPKPKDVKANFKTPEEFAAFLRVWARDKFAKTHGLTTLGKVEQDRLFAEFYRICVRKELQDLADKLLAPKMTNDKGELVTNQRLAKIGNGARVWVNKRLQDIEKGMRPDTIERASADIFAFINKAAIRVSRVDLITTFKQELKKRFLEGAEFDEFKQDTERKLTGWLEEATRYIIHVCDLSRKSVNGDPSQLEQEYRALHDILDKREKVYDESGRDVADAAKEDAETRKAQWKLALLDKYGAMRSLMPGQILDLQNAAFEYLENEAVKLEEAWKETREEQDRVRRDFAGAIVGPGGQRYDEKKHTILGWISNRFLDSLNGMIRLRLEHLTRFAGADERAKAKDAVNSILVMLGDGEVAYARALQADREAFFTGLGEIFKREDGKPDNAAIKKYLERMDEPIPVELSRQLSNQGYAESMTFGQMLQLLVSLEQRSFKDTIEENGREGQAELIRTFRYRDADGNAVNAFTKEDDAFVDMLRAFYAAKRDQISEVTERMVGQKVDSPDPLYCPIRRWMGDKARDLHADPTQRWDPISKIFSRRVPSTRDFDESRTIVGLFFENSKESAKLTAWAERGSFIRNVVTSAAFQSRVRTAFGPGELAKILKQLEATFNGGEQRSQTPGEVAAADKAVNFVTYAYLGFNPLSALKQTTSFAVWANQLPNGFADLWRHMTHFDRKVLKHLKESDEYKVRYGNAVGSGMDYATKGINMNPGQNPVSRALSGAGMWMLKRSDFVPGGWIAQGVYKDLLDKHLKEGMAFEEADRLAITETFNMLEETQQSGRTYNTNMLQIEHGRIGRLLTQFATSPLQQLQYETQAWREWRDMVRYKMGKERIAEARAKLRRAVVINHVIIPAALNLVIAMYKAALGEEPPWEKDGFHWTLLVDLLLGQFSRVFFIGAFSTATLNALLKRESPRAGQVLPIEGAIGMASTGAFLLHDLATMNVDKLQKDLERAMKSTAPTRLPYNIYRRITGDSDADRKAKKEAQKR